MPLWPFLGRFDSSLRGRLFPGKASNLTGRRGRHTEMVSPGASASFAIRGSGCTSEGWPLGLRGLPPRGGGGSPAGPLANPRFASAGRLRTHGSSVGSSLPPPVPYPGSACLEISSWSSVFSPQRQTSTQMRPWVPSAAYSVAAGDCLRSVCSICRPLRDLELPGGWNQGPWTTSPAAFIPGARVGVARTRIQAHAASLQSPAAGSP